MINSLLDYTLLSPDLTKDDVRLAIKEAKKYGFHNLVLRPEYSGYAAKKFPTSVAIGFPKIHDKIIIDENCLDAFKSFTFDVDSNIKKGQFKRALRTDVQGFDILLGMDIREHVGTMQISDQIMWYLTQAAEYYTGKDHKTIDFKFIFSTELLTVHEVEHTVNLLVAALTNVMYKYKEFNFRVFYKTSSGMFQYKDNRETLSKRERQLLIFLLNYYDPTTQIKVKWSGGISALTQCTELSRHIRTAYIGTSRAVDIVKESFKDELNG